jgi:general secretion pathway protein I
MRQPKGFSLLEILVAFAIMAVALTIVLRIFGSAVNAAVVSEDYTLAVQVAESLMARTGIETPLEAGETTGTEAEKYDWLIRISPVAMPTLSTPRFKSQQQETSEINLQLMSVEVRVSWGDDEAAQRSFELTSLRLFRNAPL